MAGHWQVIGGSLKAPREVSGGLPLTRSAIISASEVVISASEVVISAPEVVISAPEVVLRVPPPARPPPSGSSHAALRTGRRWHERWGGAGPSGGRRSCRWTRPSNDPSTAARPLAPSAAPPAIRSGGGSLGVRGYHRTPSGAIQPRRGAIRRHRGTIRCHRGTIRPHRGTIRCHRGAM